MAEGNGRSAYEVSYAPVVADHLLGWSAVAALHGLLTDYAADLRYMHEQLRYRPVSWGDRLNDHPVMGVASYRGLTRFLIVLYGVHPGRRMVFVKEVRPRPDQPLADDTAS